jgi:hypothetical protein
LGIIRWKGWGEGLLRKLWVLQTYMLTMLTAAADDWLLLWLLAVGAATHIFYGEKVSLCSHLVAERPTDSVECPLPGTVHCMGQGEPACHQHATAAWACACARTLCHVWEAQEGSVQLADMQTLQWLQVLKECR